MFLISVLNETPTDVLEQLHEAQISISYDTLVLCKCVWLMASSV